MMRSAMLLIVLGCLFPAQVSAQWSVAPFAGVTFSSESGLIDLDAALGTTRAVYGAAVGWRRGWFSVDAEIGRSDAFFEGSGDLVERGRVTTLMGNVSFIVPPGRARALLRPFVGIGIGVVRAEQRDVLDVFTRNTTLLGGNLAAGVLVRLRPAIDVRADVRYFRSVDREGTTAFVSDFIIFWRTTGGVVFRF